MRNFLIFFSVRIFCLLVVYIGKGQGNHEIFFRQKNLARLNIEGGGGAMRKVLFAG